MFFLVDDSAFIVVENTRKAFSIPVSISEQNTVIPVIRQSRKLIFGQTHYVTSNI